MGMKIAFYKGTESGVQGLVNRAVRMWMSGPYSHCELVFSDDWCASASWMDKGVRFKQINLDSGNWDLVEVGGDEAYARGWFVEHQGMPYDLLGDFGFVWRPIRGMDGAFFCSEAIAYALQWKDPWRYDPNTQAAVARSMWKLFGYQVNLLATT